MTSCNHGDGERQLIAEGVSKTALELYLAALFRIVLTRRWPGNDRAFSRVPLNLGLFDGSLSYSKQGLFRRIFLLAPFLDFDDMLHLGAFGVLVYLPFFDHRVILVPAGKS